MEGKKRRKGEVRGRIEKGKEKYTKREGRVNGKIVDGMDKEEQG